MSPYRSPPDFKTCQGRGPEVCRVRGRHVVAVGHTLAYIQSEIVVAVSHRRERDVFRPADGTRVVGIVSLLLCARLWILYRFGPGGPRSGWLLEVCTQSTDARDHAHILRFAKRGGLEMFNRNGFE